MTITASNDTVTYKSPRGDTERPADLVVPYGSAADNAAATGNPIPIGLKFESSLPTYDTGDIGYGHMGLRGAMHVQIQSTDSVSGIAGRVTNADAVAASSGAVQLGVVSFPYAFNGTTFDRFRGTTTGLIVIPPAPWSFAAATGGIDNSSTAVTIKAAGAAGVKNYVTKIQIAHATLGASTELAIRDGAAGTVLWRTLLHTTAMPSATFDVHLSGTAATLLEVVTLTAVTGDVLVNVQGYTGP